MADYTATADVNASPDAAYGYLHDLTNLPDWDSSVRASSESGSGRYDVTVGFYGKALDTVYDIVESNEPDHLAWTVTGKANGRTDIRIVPNDTGCTITVSASVKLGGLARLLDRGLGIALEGIGENVEKGLRKALA